MDLVRQARYSNLDSNHLRASPLQAQSFLSLCYSLAGRQTNFWIMRPGLVTAFRGLAANDQNIILAIDQGLIKHIIRLSLCSLCSANGRDVLLERSNRTVLFLESLKLASFRF